MGKKENNHQIPAEIKNDQQDENADSVLKTEEETEPNKETTDTELSEKEIVSDESVNEAELAVTKDTIEEDALPKKRTRKKKEVESPVIETSEVATVGLEIHEQLLKAEAETEDNIEARDAEEELEIDFTVFSKEQLLEVLEETVNNDDINKVKNRVSLIKVEFLRKIKEEKQQLHDQYISDGGVLEDYKPEPDPAEEKFQQIFEIYKTKKARFNELFEQQKQENLAAKLLVLEELKTLVNSEETLKRTYDEFKILQERWKEIGQVPRAEVNNLWQNYHFLVEKFFDKVKINKELKDLDLKKNLEQKMLLCEKAEELLLSPSIHRSFKQLQRYHDEWKEIGPVPQDKKDEIWERFKTVTDRINLMRKDYYSKLQEDQENNLVAKNALCEKLENLLSEEITTMQAWKEKTDEVTEITNLWQAMGRAPAKTNDEVWNRFKKSINNFYILKKEFFNSLKEQQINNYNLKVNLCLEAEAMKTSTNWKKTTSDFLKLQLDWKKIGPVPRKYSDKIWKRFRTACDEFFNAKAHYFSNIGHMEEDNMAKKLDLLRQIEEYPVSDNKNTNLEALRNFQRTWMEIGHVPIDKKDKLQNDFRSAINKLLDKLKISTVEASTINYKNKIESLKSSPDGNKVMFRERNILESKINKLQSDINLWENNMGFFAASKNADILKAEFENKIKSAKEELLLLKAKMKVLSRSNQ
jgi:hypothetical protein